jgi:hypothetical protein
MGCESMDSGPAKPVQGDNATMCSGTGSSVVLHTGMDPRGKACRVTLVCHATWILCTSAVGEGIERSVAVDP